MVSRGSEVLHGLQFLNAHIAELNACAVAQESDVALCACEARVCLKPPDRLRNLGKFTLMLRVFLDPLLELAPPLLDFTQVRIDDHYAI